MYSLFDIKSIDVHFNLLDDHSAAVAGTPALFESKDIPLSKATIIVVLIAWQLVTFNLTARREQMRGLGHSG